MHFEIRKISFHTIREFAKEYLMIVVGILTALGLEHLVTHHLRTQAAEQARREIVAELRANLQEVLGARKENQSQQKSVEKLANTLKRDILAGKPRATIDQHLAALLKGHFSMGFQVPTLRHEAWDVAVANQSAADIAPAALRRFSAAYAAQRDSSTLAAQGSLAILDAPRVLEVMVDVDLQRADPVETLKALVHIDNAIGSAQSNLRGVQTELEKALAGEPGATGQARPKP